MTPLPQSPVLAANIAELRASTVRRLAFMVGGVGYLWLMAVMWLQVGSGSGLAWAGALALAILPFAALAASRRSLPCAAGLLMAACLAGVACAVVSYGRWELTYLLVLPVLFASVLLGLWPTLAVAAPLCVLLTVFLARRLALPLNTIDFALPVAVIVTVALLAVHSARNLYVALEWVWSGYQEAHANQLIAREGQAELRRTLKALDESSYRLERANYMLALARSQADEARRLRQQFSQTISHELRTPLNLIVSFTELMMGSPEHYVVPDRKSVV